MLVRKFLECFNTKIGIFFLACILKITRGLFKKMFAYDEKEIPVPSIKNIVINFKKI